MPRRLDREIRYSQDGYYLFFDTDNGKRVSKKFQPDSPEYFTWLDRLKSFHFEGKEGWFTARREPRKNNKGEIQKRAYWLAYRTTNKRRFRKFLGLTEKLSIANLESAARYLTDMCTSQVLNSLEDSLKREIELLNKRKPE
jgi:hypothetical protein